MKDLPCIRRLMPLGKNLAFPDPTIFGLELNLSLVPSSAIAPKKSVTPLFREVLAPGTLVKQSPSEVRLLGFKV